MDDDQGLAAGAPTIFAAAVAAEASNSRPRKHHLVPRSYLRRWEDDGKLRVTEVDTATTYLPSASNAARVTDFYRFESPDLDPNDVPPMVVETILGRIEAPAVAAIDALLESKGRRPDPEAVAVVARFLGIQHTRGRGYRMQLRDLVNKTNLVQYGRMTEEGVRRMLEEGAKDSSGDGMVDDAVVSEAMAFLDGLKAGDITIQPQDAWIMGMALQQAELLGHLLIAREWHVIETPAALVTCDEPLVLVGGPGTSRAEVAGIAGAGVAVFPLAPDALLAMFRMDMAPNRDEPRLDHVELAEINREIISNATRWAFERPSRKATLGLKVPPLGAPVRFQEGLELVGGPEGSEVVRVTRSSRWAAEPWHRWPVERWWTWAQEGPEDEVRARRAGQETVAMARAAWEARGDEWPGG